MAQEDIDDERMKMLTYSHQQGKRFVLPMG